MQPQFEPFNKIARLSREMYITEKIDGTNATIVITDSFEMYIASRNRWISMEDDNMGFAKWCYANHGKLMKLGVGWHRGEWWGQGIQRGYGLKEKRFSLFNVARWNDENVPACCHVVPLLYRGIFDTQEIAYQLAVLATQGSMAAPGFMNPEGVVVFHTTSGQYFKKTIKNDETPKSLQ